MEVFILCAGLEMRHSRAGGIAPADQAIMLHEQKFCKDIVILKNGCIMITEINTGELVSAG